MKMSSLILIGVCMWRDTKKELHVYENWALIIHLTTIILTNTSSFSECLYCRSK